MLNVYMKNLQIIPGNISKSLNVHLIFLVMLYHILKLYFQRIFMIIIISHIVSTCDSEFCTANKDSASCRDSVINKIPRYILYDVNPPEGFNLRRDVYMRMAIFSRKLQKHGDWHLILPPWTSLYHWQSSDVGTQELLPWGLFFDIPSLQKFAPVLEMHTFLKEYGSTMLDQVFILQHYKDAWAGGEWEEKYDIEPCHEKYYYKKLEDGTFTGLFWGYSNITAKEVQCLSFNGHASQLKGVLDHNKARTIMFDHAEVALHDTFGDKEYWMARRSMRFAYFLRKIAANFREEYLNSTDESDGTLRPDDWTEEKATSETKGGPYICVHLRRQDFTWGRPKEVPSIAGAAKQLKQLLQQKELDTLFVATDAPNEEFEELQHHLSEYTVLRYKPSAAVKQRCKDGGVAIIEQIICSHARFFIGTYVSTFSFRIQEEREIMGFPVESTFNRLCGDSQKKCSKPSIWKIVF